MFNRVRQMAPIVGAVANCLLKAGERPRVIKFSSSSSWGAATDRR